MLFISFNNANIQFAKKKLTQRFYIIAEILHIIKYIESINKNKFVKAILEKNIKVYITFFRLKKLTITIYSIKKIQITLLFTKKIKILVKYLDILNIFSKKKALVLLELINLNQHVI